MSDTTLILLGAGSSTRFKANAKKQWLYCGDMPLWLHVAQTFVCAAAFKEIIIVSSKEEIRFMQKFANFTYVEGGNSRQASLANAIEHVDSKYVLVSDIARCCIDQETIKRILDAKTKASCVVPVLDMVDTLYVDGIPADREKAKIIQTPQLSIAEVLKKALKTSKTFTDESSAIADLGESVAFVTGSATAHKLTTVEDLKKLSCLKPPSSKTLTGFGIDIHPFEEGKKMFLCGVPIEAEWGFKAHSDGDVAIHALIDALLGAAGMGDIGELYPDSDEAYKGVDSKILLKDTTRRLSSFGYVLGNVDLTIMAETPKITPYKPQMQQSLASLLGINQHLVNIKATTAEKLGFVGRKEGVVVYAVANLTYFNWKAL